MAIKAEGNSEQAKPSKLCACECHGTTKYIFVSADTDCHEACKIKLGVSCVGRPFEDPDRREVDFYVMNDSLGGACPCDHQDLATTLPGGPGLVLRIGFGGGGTPGQYPKPGPRDEKLCIAGRFEKLDQGSGAGKSCDKVTPIEIMDCVVKRPAPEGEYGVLFNNCQHDISATMKACCLRPCHPDAICFREGTEVMTNKGYRRIEDLEVGDLVESFSLHDGMREPATVTALFCTRVSDTIVTLVVNDREVACTGNHPFLVRKDRALYWIPAKSLTAGDLLVGPSGSAAVTRVSLSFETIFVYNLHVSPTHVYVIRPGVYVHNK
jgi:hypothetical protein